MAGHVFESKFFDLFDIENDQLVKREPVSEDFLADDEIPASLVPILQRIVKVLGNRNVQYQAISDYNTQHDQFG